MADVKTENVGGGDVKEKPAGGGDVEEKPTGGGDVEEKPAVTEVKKETNGFKEEVSDLERKIIEQIEYYFGNCNLPKDKFLQQQIKLDDGWVPLETMMKFNRLAKLSTDTKVISSAMKKSKSGLMEVHEDETKIRRCPTEVLPEMNEARRQELVTRSLYVKGFPTEDIELDTLLQFFAKYTKLEQLIMRKHHDKAEKQWLFKGSVFAVFPSIEEAEKFLNLKDIKYEDKELIIKWQKDYIEDKRNIRLQSKLENQNKKRKIKDDVKDEEDGEDEEEEKNKSLPTGASLHISDCPGDISREDIKTKIEELGVSVAFVYFNKGETEGRVRLQEAGSAAEVVKNLKDGKLEINGKEVTVKAIEGEEEIQFLEKAKEDKAKRRIQNSKNQRGRKGKGGGGGNWRKRKGNHFREDNETSGKKSRQ